MQFSPENCWIAHYVQIFQAKRIHTTLHSILLLRPPRRRMKPIFQLLSTQQCLLRVRPAQKPQLNFFVRGLVSFIQSEFVASFQQVAYAFVRRSRGLHTTDRRISADSTRRFLELNNISSALWTCVYVCVCTVCLPAERTLAGGKKTI